MKVMHDLVAYFDRRGKLSRRQLRKLLEQNFVASDAPVYSITSWTVTTARSWTALRMMRWRSRSCMATPTNLSGD